MCFTHALGYVVLCSAVWFLLMGFVSQRPVRGAVWFCGSIVYVVVAQARLVAVEEPLRNRSIRKGHGRNSRGPAHLRHPTLLQRGSDRCRPGSPITLTLFHLFATKNESNYRTCTNCVLFNSKNELRVNYAHLIVVYSQLKSSTLNNRKANR